MHIHGIYLVYVNFFCLYSISIVYPYSKVGSGGWCCKSGAGPAAPKQPTMVSVCLVLQNLQMGESKGWSSQRKLEMKFPKNWDEEEEEEKDTEEDLEG